VTGAETDEEEELMSLLRSLRFEAYYPNFRSAGGIHSARPPASPLEASHGLKLRHKAPPGL
jgi:hypothetical protein